MTKQFRIGLVVTVSDPDDRATEAELRRALTEARFAERLTEALCDGFDRDPTAPVPFGLVGVAVEGPGL